MAGKEDHLDLATIRARLAGARGKAYWRSLEELAETEGFQELLRREFPRQASTWLDPVGRREFLRLMGASLALAGLGGCGSPAPTDEKIVPYVRQPEAIVPGKPLFFATAVPMAGFGIGVLVESHEGRPTKIEGNPQHPASLGATDAFAQASVLALYDPDRSQVVTRAGRISTWDAFFSTLNAELETQRLRRGAGLRVLTETATSPTLAGQLRALLAKFPEARWHPYEPAGRDAARAGARLAFGENVRGGVILGDEIFFWTPQGAWFVGGTGEHKEVHCPRPVRGILAAGTVQNQLLVLDTVAQAIFHIESNASCRVRFEVAPFDGC